MKKRRIFGKLLTGMMAAAMLFSLSGCGGNSGAENPPTEPETSNSGEDLSLENVKNLGMYLPVLWQSILYSLISAFICLLLGYPVAY